MEVIVVLYIDEKQLQKDGTYRDVLMELTTLANVDPTMMTALDCTAPEIVADKFFNSDDAAFVLYDRVAMAHAVIRRSHVRSMKVLLPESIGWEGVRKRAQLDLIL